jgi:hypothetical protein
MKIGKFLESKIFISFGFLLGITSLIFGNMDSPESANSPTGLEDFFNYLAIFTILTLGYGLRKHLFLKIKFLQRVTTWPRFAQTTLSIFLVMILFGLLSIPAIALRQIVDPTFKTQHLQVQIDLKAAAEKAAAEKAAAEKAAAEKAAAEKAAPPKTDNSSEKLAGFDAAHIRSFKTMVSNIRAYVLAINSGNAVRSSQLCNLLDDNYNGSLRGVYTRSSNTQIQDLLDFAKDYMYAGVVDCTRGFRKNRVDLIGDSVNAFIVASKYLDGLVMVSQVK